MLAAEEYGWLHGLETAGLDTFLRVQAENNVRRHRRRRNHR